MKNLSDLLMNTQCRLEKLQLVQLKLIYFKTAGLKLYCLKQCTGFSILVTYYYYIFFNLVSNCLICSI